MANMAELFNDELLGVIGHWHNEHPRETVWFIDYGEMVLALAYPTSTVWPLTGASAMRRYYPMKSSVIDSPDEDVLFMLKKLSDWAESKPEFSEMATGKMFSVVFQVDEDGFTYSIFQYQTLH